MTDYMASLVGVVARQQVLVSITLPPSSRIPPRSGCLAAAGDRAVLWPQGAGDPAHRLEGPVLAVSWTDNQAWVEGAAVCGCGRADMVILSLFGTQAAEGRQKGQEGEEHAQRSKARWFNRCGLRIYSESGRVPNRQLSPSFLALPQILLLGHALLLLGPFDAPQLPVSQTGSK